jgi:hypothetical protein
VVITFDDTPSDFASHSASPIESGYAFAMTGGHRRFCHDVVIDRRLDMRSVRGARVNEGRARKPRPVFDDDGALLSGMMKMA